MTPLIEVHGQGGPLYVDSKQVCGAIRKFVVEGYATTELLLYGGRSVWVYEDPDEVMELVLAAEGDRP